MIRSLVLFTFYFLLCPVLSAQYEDGLKFGKVTDEDRQLMTADGDTTAEAYVLYDRLDLRFDYLRDKGPVTEETFHRRVKLLKPASFDRANVSLSYDGDYQSISNIDAEVHLPDGETIKLKNRDIVREQGEDDRVTYKFTFPQVTAGAIIEYSYRKVTESILVPTVYTFQENIPVRWAEYTAMIPKYYRYVSLGQMGNYHIEENKREHRRWHYSQQSGSSDVPSIFFNDLRYVMKDIAAFTPQPYTNNLTDYLPQVRLQLQSVEYPNQVTKPVFNNWQTTVDELQERKDFGRYYRIKANYNKLWKEAEPIIMAGSTLRERIDLAYYYLASRLEWNGEYRILASDAPDNIMVTGIGNSADLNIALLALLNEAGIEAHPLLVSLRNRGAPVEVYPLINQFNHLMVYTEVDGQPYLLDVNGPSRPPGLPRVEALNHRGWVADQANPHWVNVDVARARRVVLANFKIDETGGTEVDLTGRLESYYAFAGRNQLASMKQPSEAPLLSEIVAKYPGTEILEAATVEGEEGATQPLTYRTKIKVPAVVAGNDYLYIQPILIPLIDAELDDVEQRLYPIDFPYPWREQYIANVEIPEGYMVEELPASIRMVSEDGGMTTTFTAAAQTEGTVTINLAVDLDRTVYQAGDYTALRSMYRHIIELQESTIVCKRAK